MKISEITDGHLEFIDKLKYNLSVRKWIDKMIHEMNEGVHISIIADGYLSLSSYLISSSELLSMDDDLKSRLSFLKTEIIDRGGSSYLSEGI